MRSPVMRFLLCFSAVVISLQPTLFGQNAVAPEGADQAAAPTGPQSLEDISPGLRRLLEDWSRASSQIEKLRGEILKRTYDHNFGRELIANGKFYYESPDRGRIDFERVEISEAMLADRASGKVPAPMTKPDPKTGQEPRPYDLVSEEAQSWICDGERLFGIEYGPKSASVANLPEEARGSNIMNTPLPFLFGLPPAKAVQRFHIDLNGINQEQGTALLVIQPLQRADAAQWKQARVILDLRKFLPIAVELTHPADGSQARFNFTNLKVNSFSPISDWWKDPFRPDLRGFNVQVVSTGDAEAPGGAMSRGDLNQVRQSRPAVDHPVTSGEAVMPDIGGYAYTEALERLTKMGIPKENIQLIRGGAAPSQNDINTVRAQDPKPATPISNESRIRLAIWERPRG